MYRAHVFDALCVLLLSLSGIYALGEYAILVISVLTFK